MSRMPSVGHDGNRRSLRNGTQQRGEVHHPFARYGPPFRPLAKSRLSRSRKSSAAIRVTGEAACPAFAAGGDTSIDRAPDGNDVGKGRVPAEVRAAAIFLVAGASAPPSSKGLSPRHWDGLLRRAAFFCRAPVSNYFEMGPYCNRHLANHSLARQLYPPELDIPLRRVGGRPVGAREGTFSRSTASLRYHSQSGNPPWMKIASQGPPRT